MIANKKIVLVLALILLIEHQTVRVHSEAIQQTSFNGIRKFFSNIIIEQKALKEAQTHLRLKRFVNGKSDLVATLPRSG